MHLRKQMQAREGGRKGVRAHSPHAQASGSCVGAASSESRTMAHRHARRTTLGPTRACSERELTRERATGDGKHLDPLIGAPPFAGPTSKEGSSVGPRSEIRPPAPLFMRTDDHEVLEHRCEPGLSPPENTHAFRRVVRRSAILDSSCSARARPLLERGDASHGSPLRAHASETVRAPLEAPDVGQRPGIPRRNMLCDGALPRVMRGRASEIHTFSPGCAHDRSLLQKSIDDVSPQNARIRDTEAAPDGASPKRTNAEGERRIRARREIHIIANVRVLTMKQRERESARVSITTSESKSRSGGVDRRKALLGLFASQCLSRGT